MFVHYKDHSEVDSHTIAYLKQLKRVKDIRTLSLKEINDALEHIFAL